MAFSIALHGLFWMGEGRLYYIVREGSVRVGRVTPQAARTGVPFTQPLSNQEAYHQKSVQVGHVLAQAPDTPFSIRPVGDCPDYLYACGMLARASTALNPSSYASGPLATCNCVPHPPPHP
jgi:hypothetical protein